MKTIWKKATTLCVLGIFSLFLACTACSDDNGTGTEIEKEKEKEVPEKPKPEEGTPKYYISSSMGSDTNDGRTKETPWKTLAKINTGTYNPGDSILLKCGDTWEEAVIFNSIFHGSETAPIVLSSYGTGNRPKIGHSSKDIRVLMLIYNADYFTVSNLDFGPFYQYGLRFDINDDQEHTNVLVENVHVHDMKLVGIYFNARTSPPYRNITISK